MSDTNFTETEIQAFADKLHAWGGTLDDKERALLRTLLISAEGAGGSEVEGFSFPGDMFSGGGKAFPSDIFVEGKTSMPSISAQTFGVLKPMAGLDKPWITAAYADTWRPT